MSQEKRLCPVRALAYTLKGPPLTLNDPYCVGFCAWYDGDQKACALLAISKLMGRLK